MAGTGTAARAATAAGVAAGAGAAQLGLGYGLGVLSWPTSPADDLGWVSSLAWAAWIAASAAVLGAVAGTRVRGGHRPAGPWRLAAAAAAAVGALVVIALVALPARAAVRADTFSPQTVAAGYAAAGVVLGLAVAYAAAASRPAADNLLATTAWYWALAVAGVAAAFVRPGTPATHPGSWQFLPADAARIGPVHWPGALLTLAVAAVLGAVAARRAVRRDGPTLAAAVAGAAGPLPVALVYLVLAPRLAGTPGPIGSAALAAPYAVLAGLGGSAAVVALARRAAVRRAGATGAGPDAPPQVPGPSGGSGAHAVPRPAGADRADASLRAAERGAAERTPRAAERGATAADPAPAERATGTGGAAAPADRDRAADRNAPADRDRDGGPAGDGPAGAAAPARGRARPAWASPAVVVGQARRLRPPWGRSGGDASGRATVTPPPANPAVATINPRGRRDRAAPTAGRAAAAGARPEAVTPGPDAPA